MKPRKKRLMKTPRTNNNTNIKLLTSEKTKSLTRYKNTVKLNERHVHREYWLSTFIQPFVSL